MQEPQTESAKLKEKYKDDRQALGMAQMELFRKHKVSPLGTCWVAFLQMPIFLGLYYALQESIHFRLAHFLWIDNLAAPDMLFSWTERIPFISDPARYPAFYYLGPFFNLLPVVAVALMITQQSLMAPPALDDQQKMQQKMMKYMMIFFGFMFYKVAAGLCIYFIASNLWGYCERKLLPKKKVNVGPVSADAALQEMMTRAPAPGQPGTAVTAAAPADGRVRGRKQGRNRKGPGGERPREDEAPASNSAWSRFRRRLGAWWADVLKKAEKK